MIDNSFGEAAYSKGKKRDREAHIPGIGEHNGKVEGSGVEPSYLGKEEDKKPSTQHDKKGPKSNAYKLPCYKLLIYHGGKDQAGGGDVDNDIG